MSKSRLAPSIHHPVLLHEIVEAVRPEKVGKKPLWYIDGTLGGAGHALAISKAMGGKLNILGIDRDPEAIERGERALKDKAERVLLVKDDFRNIDQIAEFHAIPPAAIILLDLGISSDELENSGRGFSFLKDEPLYMTYGSPDEHPFTARDIVNRFAEGAVANILFGYADERYAKRIAKAIRAYRKKKLIETSGELAEIVRMAVPPSYRHGKIHPATKTFQALRIAVNDELNALEEGLAKCFDRLADKGRLAVISFHSGEDRMVKKFFRDMAKKGADLMTKKPITPTKAEISGNPRARSAKLRIIQRNIQ